MNNPVGTAGCGRRTVYADIRWDRNPSPGPNFKNDLVAQWKSVVGVGAVRFRDWCTGSTMKNNVVGSIPT